MTKKTFQPIIQFLINLVKQPYSFAIFLIIIDFIIAASLIIQALNFKITVANPNNHLKKLEIEQYQTIKSRIKSNFNFGNDTVKQ